MQQDSSQDSEGALWVWHSHVVGTDRALVVVRGAVCAANWIQVPWTGYQHFAVFRDLCLVPGAVNLAKQGQIALLEPLLCKKS